MTRKRERRISRNKRILRLRSYTAWMWSSVIPGLRTRRLPRTDPVNLAVDECIEAISRLVVYMETLDQPSE